MKLSAQPVNRLVSAMRNLYIERCPDIVNLSLVLLAAPNLEAFSTDANYILETEVSLDSLEQLFLCGSEKPLYGHKLFISIFNGLKELHVYHGSMSCLFTPSIARCLDSLQVSDIYECYEMVKVIEDEENEETVGSGGDERTLLFPKLKTLKLWDLPKLVSFCEWKCDIESSSLRDMVLRDCPVLRNFTMGSIAAVPNLKQVYIGDEYIGGGTKDLNSVVQEYMLFFYELRGRFPL